MPNLPKPASQPEHCDELLRALQSQFPILAQLLAEQIVAALGPHAAHLRAATTAGIDLAHSDVSDLVIGQAAGGHIITIGPLHIVLCASLEP